MAAQALSANGAKVYITSRRADAIENAADSHDPSGGQIIALKTTDVTSKDSLDELVKEVEKREKHINLLICNAGIPGPKAPPEQTDAQELKDNLWKNESVEEWQDTFKTDVTSVYFTTVAFLPLLQAAIKPKGPMESLEPSVIVISSMSGIMRESQGHFAYNTAKGGTVHLTKLMSAEFQKTGIRVNSIAPGYFPSEMTTKTSDENQKSELPDEKVQDKGHVPKQRGGKEEEMGMGIVSVIEKSLQEILLTSLSSSWLRTTTSTARSSQLMVVFSTSSLEGKQPPRQSVRIQSSRFLVSLNRTDG